MAVYFNLAIDCADNVQTADCLTKVYSKIVLDVPGYDPISPDVEHIRPKHHWGQPTKQSDDAGDWHTVCVSPAELANNLELANDQLLALHDQLYSPLKTPGLSFRSAWFGWEAQDVVGETDWIDTLVRANDTGVLPDMPGLIVAKRTIENRTLQAKLSLFCEGYFWLKPDDLS